MNVLDCLQIFFGKGFVTVLITDGIKDLETLVPRRASTTKQELNRFIGT